MPLKYSARSMASAMDECSEAERLGYDSAWSGEAYGTDAVTPTAWILPARRGSGGHRHHADAAIADRA